MTRMKIFRADFAVKANTKHKALKNTHFFWLRALGDIIWDGHRYNKHIECVTPLWHVFPH